MTADSCTQHPLAAARMAIINGDRLKAEALHAHCAERWGFDVVALEFTTDSGLAAVERTKPDLVLVALSSLAGVGPAEIIRPLRAASPSSGIIGQLDRCLEYPLHLLAGCEYHGLVLDPIDGIAGLSGDCRMFFGVAHAPCRISKAAFFSRAGRASLHRPCNDECGNCAALPHFRGHSPSSQKANYAQARHP
jgi:hypothetical protein